MTNPNVPPVPQMPQPTRVPMQAPAQAPSTAPAFGRYGQQPSMPQPPIPAPTAPQAPQATRPAYQAPQQPTPAPQFAAPQQPSPTFPTPAAAPNGLVPAAPMAPTPQPQQPEAVYSSRPARQLRTKRGLAKFILLGIITLGIYDLWQMSEIGESLNLMASRRDGKKTMHYCLLFFLVGPFTLGIGYLVWFHRMSGRIGEEQRARGMAPTVTAATFWLWDFLGSLIIVGPAIYYYKLLHAMNDLSADYNVRG